MNINSVDNGSARALSVSETLPAEHAAATTRQVAEALRKVSESTPLPANQEFSLSLDRASKLPIIRIVNSDTREVIFQVPTEEVVRMATYLEAQSANQNEAQNQSS